MLNRVPAQLRVQVIRSPRYGCRGCEGAVLQAPAPQRSIDGGMATEALLANMCWSTNMLTTSRISPVADLRPPGCGAGSFHLMQLGKAGQGSTGAAGGMQDAGVRAC